MAGRQDIKGKKFGKLTAIEIVSMETGRSHWRCECDCGGEFVARRHCLTQGSRKDCGCVGRELDTLNTVFRRYVRQAKERGLEFSLTKENVGVLIKRNCSYCGRAPNNRVKPNLPKYQGIDRVDSSKGYTKENCTPACIYCNQAKSDRGLSDFHNWIWDLFKHSLCDRNE